MLGKIAAVLVLCQVVNFCQAGVIGDRVGQKDNCSELYGPCEKQDDCCSLAFYCQKATKQCTVIPDVGGKPQTDIGDAIELKIPENPGCGLFFSSCNKKEDCCARWICNSDYKCAKAGDSGGSVYESTDEQSAGVAGQSPAGVGGGIGGDLGGYPSQYGYPPAGVGGGIGGDLNGYPPAGVGGGIGGDLNGYPLAGVGGDIGAGVIGDRVGQKDNCSQLYGPCEKQEDCCSAGLFCHKSTKQCKTVSDPGGPLPGPGKLITIPKNPGCGLISSSCNKTNDCCFLWICNSDYKCAIARDSGGSEYESTDEQSAGVAGQSPAGVGGGIGGDLDGYPLAGVGGGIGGDLNGYPLAGVGGDIGAGVIGDRVGQKDNCSQLYGPCEKQEDCCSAGLFCHKSTKQCKAVSDPGGPLLGGPDKLIRIPKNPGCGLISSSCNKTNDCCFLWICNSDYKCAIARHSGGSEYESTDEQSAGVAGQSPAGVGGGIGGDLYGYPPAGVGGGIGGDLGGYPPAGIGGGIGGDLDGYPPASVGGDLGGDFVGTPAPPSQNELSDM